MYTICVKLNLLFWSINSLCQNQLYLLGEGDLSYGTGAQSQLNLLDFCKRTCMTHGSYYCIFRNLGGWLLLLNHGHMLNK